MSDGRKWLASACSNIALIKYMGKVKGNQPTNMSVSYSLRHLRTYVELTLTNAVADSWEPLEAWTAEQSAVSVMAENWEAESALAPAASAPLASFALSEKGRARFLAHLQMLKEGWGHEGSFIVRSANGFPADCGLASSASSFAALTTAAALALTDLTRLARPRARDLAELSRRGSGSSCRSFFAPWGLWTDQGASAIDLPYGDLLHQTIVVSDAKKAVSSSAAHARVAASALFVGRPERANLRLGLLISALSSRDWKSAYEVSWSEFWDMHALFETCLPPFGYMTAGSIEVASYARDLWSRVGDGPIVTMDAGANVHFLFRRDQKELFAQTAHELGARFQVIASDA